MLARWFKAITELFFGPVKPVVYVDEATVRRLEKLAREQDGFK